MAASGKVPEKVREALQDAMEIAIANVPSIDGQVVVCPDVSGSMAVAGDGSPQGRDDGGALHRRRRAGGGGRPAGKPKARVLPFEQNVWRGAQPARRVMTNAAKLAAIGGGGTNCSAPSGNS